MSKLVFVPALGDIHPLNTAVGTFSWKFMLTECWICTSNSAFGLGVRLGKYCSSKLANKNGEKDGL